MEQQKVTSLRSLTLGGFMASVTRNVEPDGAYQIKRFVQKGVFEELWRRASSGSDVKNLRTFSNVGLMASTLFQNSHGRPDAGFKKRLKAQPLVGHIRSRISFHDDIRFIMTIVGGAVYLLLDNAAMDSKMTTVMVFNTDADCFVEHDSLIDFAMNNDILV
jgi:hypothetical protein